MIDLCLSIWNEAIYILNYGLEMISLTWSGHGSISAGSFLLALTVIGMIVFCIIHIVVD